MGLALGQAAMPVLQQAIHDLFFGTPAAPPDPAEQQRQLAAQQLNNSGLYLLRQKNYAGAINEFQKALAIIPNDANILHNLAMAKQGLKNTALAGQTSGALSTLLGNAPANSGILGLDQLTHSSIASPNDSALNLVKLPSDANAADLRGSTAQPSAQPADNQETVQALDNVLGNGVDPELKRQLDDFANNDLPQNPDSNSAQPSPAAQPETQNQNTGAEQTTKDIDQAIGQTPGADVQQPPAQVGTANAPGAVSGDATTQQSNSHLLDNIGNPDFDGSSTGNAPLGSLHPNSVQSGVYLRGAGTTTVDPARVNGSSASNAGSGTATAPALPMSHAVSGGLSAPGAPIFDCVGDATTMNRLIAGLPAQQEAIKRTQAALDAAREDAQHDGAEAREEWVETAIKILASQASSIAKSSQELLAREESLKAAGITPNAAARFKFLEKVQKIHEFGERLEAAGNSYLAGKAFGNTVLVEQTARDLTDTIAEAGVLLVDSGIAEEAGGKFALALWGPIGELGFSGVTTGLDLLTATSTGLISAAQADQAAFNLEGIRSQYQRIQDRIYDLQQEIAQGCSKIAN